MRRLAAAILLMGSTHPASAASDGAFRECGLASWYNLRGVTASGTRADPSTLTAAHRSLPFGTRVTVRDLATDKTVVVTIDDRGPFVRNRIIDVSEAAARELGFLAKGVTRVEISAAGDTGRTEIMFPCEG